MPTEKTPFTVEALVEKLRNVSSSHGLHELVRAYCQYAKNNDGAFGPKPTGRAARKETHNAPRDRVLLDQCFLTRHDVGSLLIEHAKQPYMNLNNLWESKNVQLVIVLWLFALNVAATKFTLNNAVGRSWRYYKDAEFVWQLLQQVLENRYLLEYLMNIDACPIIGMKLLASKHKSVQILPILTVAARTTQRARDLVISQGYIKLYSDRLYSTIFRKFFEQTPGTCVLAPRHVLNVAEFVGTAKLSIGYWERRDATPVLLRKKFGGENPRRCANARMRYSPRHIVRALQDQHQYPSHSRAMKG